MAALENARDDLSDSDHLAVVARSDSRATSPVGSLASTVRLEVEMAADFLKASEAARRLGKPTKEVLRLIHERKVRYLMVKGIAHVSEDAVEEFRAEAS